MNICGNDLAPLCANNARLRVKSSVVPYIYKGLLITGEPRATIFVNGNKNVVYEYVATSDLEQNNKNMCIGVLQDVNILAAHTVDCRVNRGVECLQKDLYSPRKDKDMRLIRVLLVQRDITHD